MMSTTTESNMALRTRIKPICYILLFITMVVMLAHDNRFNRRLKRFDSSAFESVLKESNSSSAAVEDMESRAKQLRAIDSSQNPLFPGVSKWTPFHAYFTTFYGCDTCHWYWLTNGNPILKPTIATFRSFAESPSLLWKLECRVEDPH